MTWTRVKNEVGHEWSKWLDGDPEPGLTIVDKDATDRFGVPLPAKPHRPLSSLANSDGKTVDQMNKEELVNFAATTGVDVDPSANKADIVSAIAADTQNDPA